MSTLSIRLYAELTTCMLQGIDPVVYLEDVMLSLAGKTKKQIAELTPARWAERRRRDQELAAK